MGLFGFIGDVFKSVINTPVVVIGKTVVSIVKGDSPKKIIQTATSPFTARLNLGKETLGVAAAAILPSPAAPTIIAIPGSRQSAAGPALGRGPPIQTAVPLRNTLSTGGSAAFSSFTPQTLTGGNPAWRFSGLSSVRSQEREVFSDRSQGRWVQSGHSVRLLR